MASNSKTKILFVIHTLEAGGAQKVLTIVANHLDAELFDVTICCLQSTGGLQYLLDGRVSVLNLGYKRTYRALWGLRKVIREGNYSIVVSWISYINAFLAAFRWIMPKTILLGRESSLPSKMLVSQVDYPSIFRILYKSYKNLDGIICQSVAMKEDLIRNFSVDKNKIEIINNPVWLPDTPGSMDKETKKFLDRDGKLLLYVGRFSGEKRAHLLVEVLGELPENYRLLLIGQGPEAAKVEQSIRDTAVSNKVLVLENCTNPKMFYYAADCLVLSSEFEGYPNVLLEAGACGCPAVVYKTEGGAKEIINGRNGIYLEPSREVGLADFAAAIEKACSGHFDREAIRQETADKFGVDKILPKYEKYFLQWFPTGKTS